MTKWKYNLVVCIICCIGCFIRFGGISVLPAGLNQDEASIGYEAYSLLYDGADRNGNRYPIHLTAWGNGQNALYAYLSIPVIKLFGLSPFSVRFINALFSCVSLLVFFLLIKTTWGRKKGLAALAFFVICPWSIMSARWGLEGNIFPALFLFGVYFLVKGMGKQPYCYLIAALFFGISLYSYGTSYLIVPVFLLLVFIYLFKKGHVTWKTVVPSIAILLLLATPMMLYVVINTFDLQPVEWCGFTIPKMVENRMGGVFNLFSGNFFYTLAKNVVRFFAFLFLQSDNSLYNAIPSFGLIYHVSLPFFLIGIVFVIVKRSWNTVDFVFLAWLASSVLLGVTIHANINRICIIVIPMLYFSLKGMWFVLRQVEGKYKAACRNAVIGFYLVSFSFFAGYYTTSFNKQNKEHFAFGLGEAIQFAEKEFPLSTINVTTHSVNMPYIYVCFYTQLDPDTYRNTVSYERTIGDNGFRKVVSVARYRFVPNSLDYPEAAIVSVDEFLCSQGKAETRNFKKFGNYYVIYPKEKNGCETDI